MAAEARRVRATWPLGPIAMAVLEADKENAFAVIRNSLSAEFRAQLHPNVLLKAAPWVAIWCVGEKADQMDITRLVREMHGIEALAKSPIVVYSDAMPLLPLPKGVLWIVSNAASTLAHSPEIRGRATCAHLLTSWEVYCREGAHDPRSVLGLGFDYAINDLGIGYDAPDLEHHSAKLGELLSRELKKQWGSSSHPVAPPSFGQLGEIVDRVLEKTPYVTSSEKSEDNPAIRTAQQSVIMRMRTKDRKPSCQPARLGKHGRMIAATSRNLNLICECRISSLLIHDLALRLGVSLPSSCFHGGVTSARQKRPMERSMSC